MSDTDALRAWLILLRTPGLGLASLRERLAAADDIEEVLAELQRTPTGLGASAGAWLKRPDEARLAADLAWLDNPGRRLLCCTDADFPPLLGHIPQPPVALFVDG
ncbi:MAG: DNA-processing protein DprA, partial [Frateuria sp.]